MKTLLSFFSMIFFTLLTIIGVSMVLFYFDLTDFPGIIDALKEKQASFHVPGLNLTSLDLPGDKTIQLTVKEKGTVEKTDLLESKPLPIVPTLALTLVPPTPEPTVTPLPPLDPVEYEMETTIRLKRYAAALQSWLRTNDRLMVDNNLLHDSAWRGEVKGSLAEIAEAGQALSQIDRPPAQYAGIDGWLKRIGPESVQLQAAYLRALDTANPDDFRSSVVSFTRIKEYLTQAAQQMIVAGWQMNK